jgi:hypothetical protein
MPVAAQLTAPISFPELIHICCSDRGRRREMFVKRTRKPEKRSEILLAVCRLLFRHRGSIASGRPLGMAQTTSTRERRPLCPLGRQVTRDERLCLCATRVRKATRATSPFAAKTGSATSSSSSQIGAAEQSTVRRGADFGASALGGDDDDDEDFGRVAFHWGGVSRHPPVRLAHGFCFCAEARETREALGEG